MCESHSMVKHGNELEGGYIVGPGDGTIMYRSAQGLLHMPWTVLSFGGGVTKTGRTRSCDVLFNCSRASAYALEQLYETAYCQIDVARRRCACAEMRIPIIVAISPDRNDCIERSGGRKPRQLADKKKSCCTSGQGSFFLIT